MEKRLNDHLTDDELTAIKKKLLSEKERIVDNFNDPAKKFNIQKSETKDSVDEANENLFISHDARLSNREYLYLKKVNKSLEKITTEEYGICEECGANIPFGRLLARLTSDLCIACKEESEMSERQSFLGTRRKSIGKSMQFA